MIDRAEAAFLLLLACALVAWGCGGHSSHSILDAPSLPDGAPPPLPCACPSTPAPSPRPGDPAPRHDVLTPEGVVVEVPSWLSGSDLSAALEEIRTVVPEADPRIASCVRGVPAGSRVIVLDPGAYAAAYSPTGLALGEWRAPSTVFVAWRGWPGSATRLPALAHEVRHLMTGDPAAGHSVGGTQ